MQGQIKGSVPGDSSAKDLGAELLAIENAVKAAVGGAQFNSAPVIHLKDVGAMIDGGSAGMSLLVDVAAGGFDITGAGEMAASQGTFATTSAGVLSATSAAVTYAVTAASAEVSGLIGAGSLMVSGSGQNKGNFIVGNGVEGTGDLTVWGNLTVKGSSVTLDTQTLVVEDDLIVIAKDFANKDGAGFVLGSDAGSHKMVWDATVGVDKWSISDGFLSPTGKFGGQVLVNASGLQSAADLAIKSDLSMSFKDASMVSALDFSHSGEHDAIFGAGGWAAGSEGLLGLFSKVKSIGASALAIEISARIADVDAEQARAEAAELILTNGLSAEISRATAAEGVLQTNITAEASARVAADGVLQTNITAEANRALAAEGVLQTNITAEASARVAADGVLDGKIATEKSRAEAAELVLTNGLSAELSARAAADTLIRTDFAAADVTNLAAAKAYTDVEQARAEAAELVLRNGLAAELVARAADVDAEEARAIAAELVLRNDLTTEIAARIADVNAEESRALAAEAVLDGKIATEKSRAEAAELVLDGKITTLTTAISDQSKRVFSVALASDMLVDGGGFTQSFPVGSWTKPALKNALAIDVFVNGQRMQPDTDFVFAADKLVDGTTPNPHAGKIAFKFSMTQGDLVVIREH